MVSTIRRWIQIGLVSSLLMIPLAVHAQDLIDINTATVSELQTLPGIGPAKANAIMEYRQANGPFESAEDLDNVPGIGPATMSNLLPLITVGGAQTGSAESPRPPAVDEEPTIDLTEDEPSSLGQPQPAAAPPSTEGSTSTSSAGLVNINTATVEELQSLPGIGPSKASAIVEYREANGPFQAVEEIDNVPGIGPATMNSILPLITIE